MSEKLYKQSLRERVSSGIKGLDEMLGGGFPPGHIVVIVGDSGTGKTTLALQYILDGLHRGESGIYISFDEEIESLIYTAAIYRWDMEKYIVEKKLKFLKLDVSTIKTTVRGVINDLPILVKSFGARRLVIDSITLFSMIFDDPIERRVRLAGLNKAIKKAGITALYTSEINLENPIHSTDGMVEYSADGVLLLQQNNNGDSTKLNMRVIKMRRTQHDRLHRPYEITGQGIVVYPKDITYHDIEGIEVR